MDITTLPLPAKLDLLRRAHNARSAATLNLPATATQAELEAAWHASRPSNEEDHPACPVTIYADALTFSAVEITGPATDARLRAEWAAIIQQMTDAVMADPAKMAAVYQVLGLDASWMQQA